jgi:hypothetical protein
MDFDTLRRDTLLRAQAMASFFRKHPTALDHPSWRWVSNLNRTGLTQLIEKHREELPAIERAARELASVNLAYLENTRPVLRATAHGLSQRLAELMPLITGLWWRIGLSEGLRDLGVQRFSDMALSPPPRFVSRPWVTLGAPDWLSQASWLPHVRHWLHTTESSRGTLVLLTDPEGGHPMGLALDALARANLEPSQALRVLEPAPAPIGFGPILRRAIAVLATEGPANDRLLAGAAERRIPIIDAPAAPSLQLRTQAPLRFLAWPNHRSTRALNELFRVFGPSLARVEGTCLMLRHDPTCDPPLEELLPTLKQVIDRHLEPTQNLEVLLVDDALHPDGWPVLAESACAILVTDATGPRASHLTTLSRQILRTGTELDAWLGAYEARRRKLRRTA